MEINNMLNYTNSYENIIKDVIAGKPIIIVDSYDRENEGDLMIAASKANVENLAFMARWARGIMCLPCLSDRLERLDIPMMHTNKLDKYSTPFANSIDSNGDSTTGVSVKDRLVTINKFTSETSIPTDFCQPGHLFPLRARKGLLKERQGHTESSIEICLSAKLPPVAVIIEVMNEDGSMARLPQLEELAVKFNLNIISIDEIIESKYEKL